MSGVFPSAFNVRQPESAEWLPLAQITASAHHQAPPPLPQSAPSGAGAPKRSIKKEDSVKQFAWIAGIVGGAFLLWLFSTAASSTRHSGSPISSERSSSPTPSRRDSSPLTTTSLPQYQIPQTSYSPLPTKTAPIDDSVLYRDSTGRTYRVPHADYNRLVAMKSALTPKKTLMDLSEVEYDSMKRQVESARITLDRTSEYEVNAFNSKIGRLNALNDSLQARVRDFNRDVGAFNTELERVGTPIR